MDTIPRKLLLGPVVSRQEILETTEKLALEIIQNHRQDKQPIILLCIDDGARNFFTLLSESLERHGFAFQKASIRAKSYQRDKSSGNVTISGYTGPELPGRSVVVVEDIIDSSLSIQEVSRYLKQAGVAKLNICVLLFKQRKSNLFWRLTGLRAFFGLPKIRYVGRFIPNYFVVGFGLDYQEYGRTLNDIWVLTPDGKVWVDQRQLVQAS